MDNLPQRPALGQIASIGTFYDARTDRFLPQSLLNGELPPSCLLRTSTQKKDVQVSYADSYKEKFEKLGIGNDLGGSILAGLLNLRGSSRYLDETREGNQVLQAAVYHRITTVQDKLNFMSSELQDCLAVTALRSSEVTHVVTGVDWGIQSVVIAKNRLLDNVERSGIEWQFRREVEMFKSAIENSCPINNNHLNGQRGTQTSLEITGYSDILADGGIIMHDLPEAYNFLELMPVTIKDENGGKGKQIMYKLLPVAMLSLFLPVEVDVDVPATPSTAECLKKFIQLFDEFRFSQQKLNDYQSFVSMHKLYMPENHLQTVSNRVSRLRTAEEAMKANFARVLQDVRSGRSPLENLSQLHRDSMVGGQSPKEIATVAGGHLEKVAFIDRMVANGATYIGHNGLSLKTELSRQGDVEAYAFLFDGTARQDEHSWKANQALLLELLSDPHRQNFVALVDCDATAATLEKPHISYYQNGQEVSNDLLELRQFLADKSFARYLEPTLETKDIQKPLKRRFVKIACPGPRCNPNEVCDWICSRCHAPLEYGHSDQYIYCDCGPSGCGRSLWSNYDFKCQSELHGSEFDQYDQGILLSLLNSLKQSDYLNILILGETGVGKSTFINAFVNYLTFETLDESMKAEKLNWVIPCSFSTQIMDRSRPDGKIIQQQIKVGSRGDEHDGSTGSAATQQTMVYPVTIGASTIRLIDTPGIGDTRGLEYDRKNMADILSTLSSYDELHGVLILLKSNNARLTVTFSFCVQQLLMHLHRSAAQNMVFGFTNTRISNYTPGDTFGPLKTLLGKHPDVGLSLSTHTTYCFDSESFRYLAAFKQGVFMENEEDFRRSWKHSRDEARRLISHFKTKPPHLVKSTISLNGTRELISELTIPMAEISQKIRDSIALCEDKMRELADKRLTGDQLRARLDTQKVTLKTETLANPRTVCHDLACTEYKDSGLGKDGKSEVVTIYKSHCHSRCYLSDVKPGVVAHPGLIHCAAFNGTNFCTGCKHFWKEHLHVLYELISETVTVKDGEIQRQLKDNASDVTLRQTAIKNVETTIQEYKSEHAQIQKAAAQFGIFLKKYSITPYNDATLEYLDYLIKDEKGKIQAGGSNKRLRALEEDRQKHEELVKILTLNMNNNANYQVLDEAGVDRLVKQLYSLKHFGKNLKIVKHTITAAHQATYREMPYRPRNRGVWVRNPFHGGSQPASQPRHSTMGNQVVTRQGSMATRTMRPVSQSGYNNQTTLSMPMHVKAAQAPSQTRIPEKETGFTFGSLNPWARK